MKLERTKLISVLKVAVAGAAIPPRPVVVEQADCLLFKGGELITFCDEVAARMPSPIPGLEAIVNAAEMLSVLERMPDREVEVTTAKGELRIKGERREAGIALQGEVKLPYEGIPKPGKWHKVAEGAIGHLKQAAETCGTDAQNPLTTVVHVTPDRIEACDNYRLIRATGRTGFPKACLIPAKSLEVLDEVPVRKVAVGDGWCHFLCRGKAIISLKLVVDDFLDLEKGLAMKGAEKVRLPDNVGEIVARSEVMSDAQDPLVEISLEGGQIAIKSRKDGGWYRETKRIKYEGRALKFHANPKYFSEAMQRSTRVLISDTKMKLKADAIEYVIILESPEEPAAEDEAPKTKTKKAKTKKIKKAKTAVEA